MKSKQKTVKNEIDVFVIVNGWLFSLLIIHMEQKLICDSFKHDDFIHFYHFMQSNNIHR